VGWHGCKRDWLAQGFAEEGPYWAATTRFFVAAGKTPTVIGRCSPRLSRAWLAPSSRFLGGNPGAGSDLLTGFFSDSSPQGLFLRRYVGLRAGAQAGLAWGSEAAQGRSNQPDSGVESRLQAWQRAGIALSAGVSPTFTQKAIRLIAQIVKRGKGGGRPTAG